MTETELAPPVNQVIDVSFSLGEKVVPRLFIFGTIFRVVVLDSTPLLVFSVSWIKICGATLSESSYKTETTARMKDFPRL